MAEVPQVSMSGNNQKCSTIRKAVQLSKQLAKIATIGITTKITSNAPKVPHMTQHPGTLEIMKSLAAVNSILKS